MTVEEIEYQKEFPFIDAVTGCGYRAKPEHMTHLRGNQLVDKTHPRIAFRGKLDSIQAAILKVETKLLEDGQMDMLGDLDEILQCLRRILASEVKEEPMEHTEILSMSAERLRYMSHHVREELGISHPIPDYHMGATALELNYIRTQIREIELAFVQTIARYQKTEEWQNHIIQVLNRLSSAVYIIFCRHLAGYYCSEKSVDKEQKMECRKLMLEASGCHVHLNQEAFDQLFGKKSKIIERRKLSQPGEFLAEQRVQIVTNKGMLQNVAVLGPLRKEVQVELSLTDSRKLGITPPVNLSGNLSGASDVKLAGENGEFDAKGSTIVARNHIHMTPDDAKRFHVKEGQEVKVRVEGIRPVIFEAVPIRVRDDFQLAMHIDFDEANACCFHKEMEVCIVDESPKESKDTMISSADKTEMPDAAEKLERSGQTGQLIEGIHGLITESIANHVVKNVSTQQVLIRTGTLITPAAKDVFLHNQKEIRFADSKNGYGGKKK